MTLQKKYVLVKQKKNYTDCSAHCKSLGGALAVPESAEEYQQIQQVIGKAVTSFSSSS